MDRRSVILLTIACLFALATLFFIPKSPSSRLELDPSGQEERAHPVPSPPTVRNPASVPTPPLKSDEPADPLKSLLDRKWGGDWKVLRSLDGSKVQGLIGKIEKRSSNETLPQFQMRMALEVLRMAGLAHEGLTLAPGAEEKSNLSIRRFFQQFHLGVEVFQHGVAVISAASDGSILTVNPEVATIDLQDLNSEVTLKQAEEYLSGLYEEQKVSEMRPVRNTPVIWIAQDGSPLLAYVFHVTTSNPFNTLEVITSAKRNELIFQRSTIVY